MPVLTHLTVVLLICTYKKYSGQARDENRSQACDADERNNIAVLFWRNPEGQGLILDSISGKAFAA